MNAKYTLSPNVIIYVERNNREFLQVHEIMLQAKPLEFAEVDKYMAYEFDAIYLQEVTQNLPIYWQFTQWTI